MAQLQVFIPYGGMEVKSGSTYTGDNVSTGVTAVQLSRGVRQKGPDGLDIPIRGVRMTITNNGLPAAISPRDNVAIVWYEGEVFKFIAGASYTFADDGVIAYGKLETI